MAATDPVPNERGHSAEDSFALLRRYRDHGDREALDQVLARQYPLVERIVRVRLGRELAARVQVSDVVQSTMLSALEGFDGFEPREDCRLIHWLAKIAENEIVRLGRHHRAQKRDLERELDPHGGRSGEGSGLCFDPAADSTSVAELVSRRELAGIVDSCLAELPVPYREVVLLREYVGGDWRFVADELERPSEEAARKLYDRARVALAECVLRRIGPLDGRRGPA